jgi:putative SOS response-associated peptidase YedK
MCGRYALQLIQWAEEYFELLKDPFWQEHFNLAPSAQVPFIRQVEGERQTLIGRWGLVPFHAKGDPGPYKTHNARIETVQTSGAYRTPWKRGQRCIVPASLFYEWHMDEKTGETDPFAIRAMDQEHVFGFGGLWDRSTKPDGTVIESCTIITMPANELMSWVHNSKVIKGKRVLLPVEERRMPAILAREDLEAWLTGSLDDALACLRPYPSDVMDAYQVSRRLNSTRNNDPALLESVNPANRWSGGQ